ncbi:MAG TPA: hypothetical protein VF054_13715 [Micromonosporaceae bacterium]
MIPAGLTLADAGPFLARLTRLDRAALVRLRPAGSDALTLWGRLPWDVLVCRTVPVPSAVDTTLGAADLLTALQSGSPTSPPARDAQWRSPLPPGAGTQVEVLPAEQVRQLAGAAAATLRAAGTGGLAGRPVGERMIRDALLDHVPIVVLADDRRVEVSQRLVQGLVRMGFVEPDGPGEVRVVVSGGWVGLAGRYGTVWRRADATLALRPTGPHRPRP